MREGILKKFQQALLVVLNDFEKAGGGRHNRRPEIAQALETLEDYIQRAQNPISLYSTLDYYMKTELSGFIKSMAFRDEARLKKCLLQILLNPEFSITALSYSLCQENEAEKLYLYRLISKLEDRLNSLESEKSNENPEKENDFKELQNRITQLEVLDRENQAQIEDLENEKWLKERECISLQTKVEELSCENELLQQKNKELESDLEELREENKKLRQSISPPSLQKNQSHLIYAQTKKDEKTSYNNSNKPSCTIM